MKNVLLKILTSLCLMVSFCAVQAQNWNLVWREDFGIAEDTVLKDFPDPSMEVVGHTFAGRCNPVNDGYYGIANSTKWAIQRWKDCNVDVNYFQPARDHTGNNKGCMLIVNVGSEGNGEAIYRQDINFKLCSQRKYKFTIYAASITSYDQCSLADLTLQILNRKTGDVIDEKKTGGIALWSGTDIYGNWTSDPFAEREWKEYSVEFTANGEDEISLLVLNHSPSGSGNDFVIDDISLYRDDQYEIPEGLISTQVISSESVQQAGACTYSAGFSVPIEAVSTWNRLYLYPYYVWQKSTNDGLTWTTMTEYSGVNKSSMLLDNLDESVSEVFRVVVSGGTTEADAKTRTEYIANNDGPASADACAYYSISNTLAGVSPEPDCSYKDNLKTIWKEDFGVIDETMIRTNANVKLNPYTTPGNRFYENDYVIASDPYTAVGEQTNPTCYYDCFQRKLTDYCSHEPNDAVLYSRLSSGVKSTILEKVLSGSFCNCKNYIFSFKAITLNPYNSSVLMKYKVYIDDDSGNIVTQDVDVSDTRRWTTCSVPFSVNFNYTGAIRIRVEFQGNDVNPVAFDDFRVSICQEKVPQASLAFDNNSSLHYIANFDCSATPTHIAGLSGFDSWTLEYPNAAFVWQMSQDGGSTWTTISETTQNHYCDDLEDGETLFRVVIGENATVAQQVAANGKPNDACATYQITNVVGLNCRGVTCTKPAEVEIVSDDADKVLCPGGSTTLSVSEATTISGTFDYLWFKDEIGMDADAVEIGHDNTSTSPVHYADAGTYVLLVRDRAYPTAQKCWQTAEIEISAATAPSLKSIEGDDEFCYGTKTMPQVTFKFEDGNPPYTFTYRLSSNDTDVNKAVSNLSEPTYSPVAPTITNANSVNRFVYTLVSLTDSYGCEAEASNLSATIIVNPVPSAVFTTVDPVCEGSNIVLEGNSNQSNVSYEWTKGDARTSVGDRKTVTLSDVTIADNETYYLQTSTAKCVSNEVSRQIVVNKTPVVTSVTAQPTEVCSGNDITFSATVDNVGEGDISYSWSGTEAGTDETLVVNKTVTSETPVNEKLVYTVTYSPTLSCSATSAQVSATIHAIPNAPDVSNNREEYCKDDEAEQLSAVGENLTWYLPDGTTSSTAPTPPTAEADKTYTYQVTQTVNGCESEKSTITVTVHPLPTPVITASKDEVCEGVEAITLGLDNVSYNSRTWTCEPTNVLSSLISESPTIVKSVSAGTYTIGVTVTDGNNCSASASQTKSVVIHPKPQVTAVVPQQTGICNLTSTVVNATVNETDGTGEWTNATETSETSATFTASAVGQSTVKYVYTSVHGCKSDEATATIQVYAIPSKPVVTNKNPRYCAGKTAATLTATPSSATAELTWYDADMQVMGQAPTPSTESAAELEYFVTQTDNSCTSDTSRIVVSVLPLPTPQITADAEAVCKGTRIELSTEEYSKYAWTAVADGYLLNANKQVSTLATTSITTPTFTVGLTVTDGNNCSNAVPVEKTVTIYPIKDVSISAQPTAICNLTSTELTATVDESDGAGTGEWINAEELTETTAKFTASQTGTQEVSYVYTSVHNCVSPTVKTNIVVYSIPAKPTVADKNISYCVNANTSPLSALSTTATANLVWFDGDGNELQGTPTPSSLTATTLVYSVKQVDNSCASDTAKITVTVHPLPTPEISVETNSACKGTPVQLGIIGGPYDSQMWTYTPSSVKVLSDQTIKAPVLLPTTPDETYVIRVEVTDGNNCKNTSESVSVTIHPNPTASISIDEKVCVNGTQKTALVESVSPSGGTGRFFASGTGVIDEVTGVFNPAESGVGEYTISYEYTSSESEGSCTTITPATATIQVLSKPSVTLTALKNVVCESGTNSNPVTMTVTANPTGGTSVFSCETATIDEAGTLTPSHENIGIHTVKLVYTDLNECHSETTANVRVSALPEVSFSGTNPSEICVKADPITLSVTPTSPGVGSFGGAVASGTLNPALVGAGENQKIIYTYVDENGCTNSAQHTISVVSVSKPTVVGGNNKMIVRGSDGELSDDPNLTAVITTAGDGIVWQKGETNESTDAHFITGLTKNSEENTYMFSLVETRELSSGTCYSDNVPVSVVISDCPAKTPLADNVYYCVEDEESVVLTAEPAEGTLAAGNKISWFNSNPTGSRDENAADLLDDNLTLSLSGYDVSVPSERTVYVAEYDAAHGCWSGGRPVVIHVLALPVVSVTVPENVCASNGVVNFSVSPATGTLMNVLNVRGFDVDAKQWDPREAIGTKNSASCIIQYSVIEDHTYGSINRQCQNVVVKTVVAHQVKNPKFDPKTWLIDDINNIPDDFMSASTFSTGKKITWYSDVAKSEILNDENTSSFILDKYALQAEIGTNSSFTKSYWVSQTDNYGCESELIEVKLNLIDCPWPAPSAGSVVACQYDETVPVLTATADVDLIGDNPTEWLWYETDGITVHSVADDNGSSSFDHEINAENPVEATYFVSYKAAVASIEGKVCESPKIPVTVTVNKAPDIKMNDTLLCYADGSRTLSAVVNGVKSTEITEGAWMWNVEGKTGGIDPLTGILDPAFEDDENTSDADRDHSYRVTYSYTDTRDCSFEKTVSVDVEYAQKPMVRDFNGIVTKPDPVVVTAENIETTKDSYSVNWFYAKSAASVASNDNPWSIPDIDPTQETTRSYWVSQTVNGCESERVEQKVAIVDCPYGKPMVDGQTVCVGGVLNEIVASTNEATPEKWVWYNSDGSMIADEVSDTYHHSVSGENVGTTVFFVSYLAKESQSGEVCESQKAQVSLVVLPLPTIALEDRMICYNEGNVIMNVSQLDYHDNGPGSGVWSVDNEPSAINENSGIFRSDFKEHTTGEYTVRYTYKDGKECENSASMNLTVQYVPEPVLTGHTSIVTENLVPQLSAQVLDGAEVNWFGSEVELTSSIHSLEWNVGLPGNVVMEQSFYASQTYNGCESDKAEVSVKIVDCPFKAPEIEDIKVCVGEQTIEDLIATTTETVQEWKWYTAEKQPITNNSPSYAHGMSTSVADTAGFYVNYFSVESVTGRACPSDSAFAQVIVLPLPEITFDDDNPSIVCYDKNGVVFNAHVDYHKNGAGQGTWSVEGYPGMIQPTTGAFEPSFNGEVNETYRVNYEYVDDFGCSNSNYESVTVRFAPKPSLSNHYALTTENRPVVLEALNLESEATVRWYARSDDMRVASTNNPWTTADKGNTETNKTYFASQVVDGCESERNSTTVEIIPCPVPNVTIESKDICVYDHAPELKITLGEWSGRNDKSMIRLFDAEGSLLSTQPIDNLNYTPTLQGGGTYVYFAEEYNEQPQDGIPAGCASKVRAKATVVVKNIAAPTLRMGEDICFGDSQTTECVALGIGEISWYEEEPGDYNEQNAAVYATGTRYRPSNNTVGTHTVWALRYDDGCYSEAVSGTYSVKPRPDAPETEGDEVCYTGSVLSNSVRVTSEIDANSFVTWYSNAEKNGVGIGSGKKYIPYVVFDGEYTYYAAVTTNGCEGDAAPATILVKDLPHSPQIVGNNYACTYDKDPMLKAVGENITWYASDKTTVLSNEETLPIDNSAASTKLYYASQTVDGCEGALAVIAFNVVSKPSSPNPIGASICAGNTDIPTLSTNLSLDKWYSDEEATNYLATGYTFTPDASMVGSADLTFYVVREQRGCFSDTVPVKLHVIPQPTFSIGNDTIVCEYDTNMVIQAREFVPPITESSFIGWTVSNGKRPTVYLDNENHQIVPENLNTPGDYTVKAFYRYKYDNVSCNSDTISMQYSVKKRARKPIVFTKVICQGEEIKDLQALGSPNMTWESLDSISPKLMRGPMYKFQNGQVLEAGTYRFKVYDIDYINEEEEQGCESVADTISMTVAPGAKTMLFGADSVCVGQTETYYTQYTQGSTYYWSVSGDNLNYSKDAMSSSVRYVDWSHIGYNTITVYEQTWAGCEGTSTKEVKVASPPRADFSWSMPGLRNVVEFVNESEQDDLIDVNEDQDTVGEHISYKMLWNFGHNERPSDVIDAEIPYEQRNFPILEGDYSYGYNCPILTIENSFGCRDSYSECFFINISSALYVPDIFSPSNPAEGVRTFAPKGFNLKTCEVAVFDHWGNMIWYSNEVRDGMFVGEWDGRYNGKMMDSGVYIWKIEATFIDGKVWEGVDIGARKKKKYGSVMLIR